MKELIEARIAINKQSRDYHIQNGCYHTAGDCVAILEELNYILGRIPSTTNGFRSWLVERIEIVNKEIFAPCDNIYWMVAKKGQLTALNQMLNYVDSHA